MANEDSIEGDKGRGSGDGDEHECKLLCFMCQRPWDLFRHIHLIPDMELPPAPGQEVEGRNFVLCIPCLAGLAVGLEPVLSAYANGGRMFDAYPKKSTIGRRGGLGRTPLPKYIEDIIGEIAKQMDDDSAPN